MKNLFCIFIILVYTLLGIAQKINGVVTYNRKADWMSILNKMPWMTQEDINRMTLNFGKRDKGEGVNYDLHFNTFESIYQPKKEKESDGGYSWSARKFVLQRNYKNGEMYDWIETLGKKYIVKDKIPDTKWKILNEIKEIQGYLCMKAETIDSLKSQTIHAWYTDAIPFNGGPEGYAGLPGMILELDINEGDAIITATDVDLTLPNEKLPVPKKIKGKEIDRKTYLALTQKYIKESMEGKRNPYWRIRY